MAGDDEEGWKLPFPLCVDDFEWGRSIARGAFSNVYIAKHSVRGSIFRLAVFRFSM